MSESKRLKSADLDVSSEDSERGAWKVAKVITLALLIALAPLIRLPISAGH